MPNQIIDLRKLRKELKGDVGPKEELPPPPGEPLLETEEAAHPGGFTDPEEDAGAMLIAWEALEFEPDPGRGLLQVALAALLFLGAIVAVVLRSYLLGIFLVLAGGVIMSYAFRQPRRLSLTITAAGIRVERRIYEFKELKSFWIAYEPPLSKELVIESKKAIMPVLRIPLGDQDPLQIREVLLRFLPEVEREDSLLDIISKRLGF